MKVNELFEAQGSPGQDGKLKGGAFYKPSYKADIGQLRGSVADWLDAMNVTPQDIEKALARVKALPIFRNDFPKAGLIYSPTPGKEKKGTLTFVVERPAFFIFDNRDGTKRVGNAKTEKDLDRTRKSKYNIYANGQIRWEGRDTVTGASQSPLKSPKPRIIAGDPVRTLVGIYTASMEELLSKWKKSQENQERQKEKAKKILASQK